MSLADIRARAEVAEPGPWHFKHCPPCTAHDHLDAQVWGRGDNALIAQWGEQDEFEQANAEFIAHARTDVPKLVAVLEAVESRLDSIDRNYRGEVTRDYEIRAVTSSIRHTITEVLG